MSERQSGSALVIVILMTVGITALLATLLISSNTDHRISANERDSERAMGAAKAGLNYAYQLYSTNAITPTTSGASFDSFATSVASALDGASFTGKISVQVTAEKKVYTITSTGTFNRASRTTELVFQTIPDSLTYGYVAFNQATLHHHDASGPPILDISSTIFSDNTVDVAAGLNINGSIVASGSVTIPATATVQGDVFSYAVSNGGTINGKVGFVASVNKTAGTPSVTDSQGNPYVWYSNRSNPGTAASGSGPEYGGTTRYVVTNGDAFNSSIFTPSGQLILNPPLNVIKYIAPPQLDYKAMKLEADKNDATYFTSMTAAMTYLASKKVTEVVGGQTMTTIKVGTTSAPEFLYVNGDFTLNLDPTLKADSLSSGALKADGLQIEGGLYVSGDFSFNGPGFTSPAAVPAGYNQLMIDATPYCYPAVVAYNQPSSGTVATWTPSNTPTMTGSGSSIKMSSTNGSYEGPVNIKGVVYGQSEVHLHHTNSAKELITFKGAELGWKLHNCDYFHFSYDPAIACTQFLGFTGGTGNPGVISYREIR